MSTPLLIASAPWGSVRSLLPAELRAIGVGGLLVGTAALSTRPGLELAAQLGGLPALAQGLLTIAEPGLRAIGEGFGLPPGRVVQVDGLSVRYRNGLDGALAELSPAGSLTAQLRLGVDILVAPTLPEQLFLNGRPIPVPLTLACDWLAHAAAVDRADRPLLALLPPGSARYRQALVAAAARLPFSGVATVGAPLPSAELPAGWLQMVLGASPSALAAPVAGLEAPFVIAAARTGKALRGEETLDLRALPPLPTPLDPDCDCPACRFALGYLVHLVQAGETLGETLLLLHNFRWLARTLQARQQPS
ncbi:MAG: hypothetical protein K6U89_16145 [Chloroflexi bacterium]|nr:hypothetical protein [Chloroflexota bacterium]